jgi:hypothetical protein
MEDNKNLPSTLDGNRSVTLHDNGLQAGSLIEQSIKRLTPEQISTIGVKAAEKAIELEAKRRSQEMDQYHGERAISDHLDAFNMRDKGGRLTSHKVKSEINTGAGKMHLESKSGPTCFVATATYNDLNHPNVTYLRCFRDVILSKSKLGRSFISWYWRVGPKLAKHVESSSLLKIFSKTIISSVVFVLRKIYGQKLI